MISYVPCAQQQHMESDSESDDGYFERMQAAVPSDYDKFEESCIIEPNVKQEIKSDDESDYFDRLQQNASENSTIFLPEEDAAWGNVKKLLDPINVYFDDASHFEIINEIDSQFRRRPGSDNYVYTKIFDKMKSSDDQVKNYLLNKNIVLELIRSRANELLNEELTWIRCDFLKLDAAFTILLRLGIYAMHDIQEPHISCINVLYSKIHRHISLTNQPIFGYLYYNFEDTKRVIDINSLTLHFGEYKGNHNIHDNKNEEVLPNILFLVRRTFVEVGLMFQLEDHIIGRKIDADVTLPSRQNDYEPGGKSVTTINLVEFIFQRPIPIDRNSDLCGDNTTHHHVETRDRKLCEI